MKPSPLLHGRRTGTPLDRTLEKLYFVFPISDAQAQHLNTVIYGDRLFWINYWSLTHAFFGFLWGLMSFALPDLFSLGTYLVVHTMFELWELWAGGYLTGQEPLTVQELMDVLMDTLFGVAGFYLAKGLRGQDEEK